MTLTADPKRIAEEQQRVAKAKDEETARLQRVAEGDVKSMTLRERVQFSRQEYNNLRGAPDAKRVLDIEQLVNDPAARARAGEHTHIISFWNDMKAMDTLSITPYWAIKASGPSLSKTGADPQEQKASFSGLDRKSTRLNSSHSAKSRMPSSA